MIAGGRASPAAGLARVIDQTVLVPLSEEEMLARYLEAADAGFAAFVTHSFYLPLLARHARGGRTPLAAVIDFPFGLSPARDKIVMISQAVNRGALEVDLVVNLADAAGGRYDSLEKELAAVEKASRGVVRKVIIETAFRDRRSMTLLASMIARTGFEFVKTSTGYAPSGAKAREVRFLAHAAGSSCGVKASGGIRNLPSCMSMLSAGATRIGTSRGLQILSEASSAPPREIARLTSLLAPA